MSNNFEVIIASVPDRDLLVAEIWLENIMVAEISKNEETNNNFNIIFYLTENKILECELNKFEDILNQAKAGLL